jgi:hypothetical protein
MPNISRPQGLRPTRHISGAPWNGQAEVFAVLAADSTALFVGDVVKLSGTADANGVAAINRLTANTELPLGVIVGFLPDYTNLAVPSQFRTASTARYALVTVDPTILYEVQASGTTVVADVGLNAGITYTAGSTSTGQSAMVLDGATKATTATLPLKIFGWVQRPDIDIADGTNMRVLVLVNSSNLAGNTAGL